MEITSKSECNTRLDILKWVSQNHQRFTEEDAKQAWTMIPWREIENRVFKLQKRIYRASKRGDSKLVRQLQKVIIKSWSAKLLAVRKVTQENRGKKTAGVDGVKSLSPKERFELTEHLKIDGKTKPTRRVWIPKPGRKEMRPLGIPTMQDRAKQALIKIALEPEWEAIFEPNSYGFRPGRSCHDAIRAIADNINQSINGKYIYDADISKCFDKINHEALLQKLNTFAVFKRQIKAWLKAGVIDFNQWADRKGLTLTEEGTPQGGVISPLLANIALHGMENAIEKAFPADKTGRIKKSMKIYGYQVKKPVLIRYADDFVIICEELAVIQECQKVIASWLKEVGLEIKPSKTKLIHTLKELEGNKPEFDFLGFTFKQYRVGKHKSGKNGKGQLLGFKTIISPSKEKIQAHYRTIADCCDHQKVRKQAELINKLNPIIRGWCNYQAPWNSKRSFRKLKNLVWRKLWRWGKRRHPMKSATWRKNKYWNRINGKDWTFSTRENAPLKLLEHTEFPSGVRWIKVQGERSPYDGDEIYWSQRMGDRYLTLDPQKSRLLKKQKGKCAHCEQYFKPDDLIEKHHIEKKSKGGNNSDNNLLLVHLHCHDQLHHEEATVQVKALAIH
jgi:RNA-directed DNA polymerase